MMLRRALLGGIILLLALALAGCGLRTRVMPAPGQGAALDREADRADVGTPLMSVEVPSDKRDDAAISGMGNDADEPDPNALTTHDPRSERREYARGVSAALTEGAEESVVNMDGESDVSQPESNMESGEEARVAENATLTVTETLSQEEAEKLGVSEEARAAETELKYYRALLDERLNALFECKRLYVYWETSEYAQTVFKTSAEHEIIQLAGGYDVSAKRPEDALQVDDGWIGRKNPGCVVKCVKSGVLGGGILTDTSARAALDTLLVRDGWESLAAVRSGNVLLLSEELLDTPAGQTAAALYLAKLMYPDQMADIDPNRALSRLMEESRGAFEAGIYAYALNESAIGG